MPGYRKCKQCHQLFVPLGKRLLCSDECIAAYRISHARGMRHRESIDVPHDVMTLGINGQCSFCSPHADESSERTMCVECRVVFRLHQLAEYDENYEAIGVAWIEANRKSLRLARPEYNGYSHRHVDDAGPRIVDFLRVHGGRK